MVVPYRLQVQLIFFLSFRNTFNSSFLALRAWNGKRENESNAQENFLKRAMANVMALAGEYK